MNINFQKLPQSRAELVIELSEEEFKPFLEKGALRISKEVTIEGFRPGKAPLEIILKKVGEQRVYQEAASEAVEKTYPQALKEKNLTTIGPPEIKVLKVAPQNPFQYKATFSLLPEVKLGDYKKLKSRKKKVEVKEEDLEKTLKDLQKSRQKERVVDRSAQKGDKVEIDFEVFMDKVPVEGGQNKNIPVVIGESHFIPGFEEKLMGAKAGEEKEFSLRFPSSYHDKNMAGREAEFKVKVNSVYEVELPPLDNEFAKGLGNFKDLKDLKEKINKNLEEEAKIKEQQRFELALMDELISQSEFEELPEVLIESELNKMVAELKQGLENQGLKFDDYLKQIRKSFDDMKKEFRPQAEKRVKTALLVRKIARTENIEASEDEIAEELQKVLSRYQGQEKFLEQAKSKEFKDYLTAIIINKKVFELLEEFVSK